MERLELDRWASPWLRHQHLARYEWASGFVRGSEVLDAACGSGYGARLLRGGGALKVTCVDLSPLAFEAARRTGSTEGLRFVVADVTRLPLEDNGLDAFVSFETLEHVDADRDMVREAHRVLRPGGTFFCSTPNRELLSPGNSLNDRPVNPYHFREYTREEFVALLQPFFPSIQLYGQTPFSEKHRARLEKTGRRHPHLAIRLHQLRNILNLPWENRERHQPRLSRSLQGVPEVMIALCRK